MCGEEKSRGNISCVGLVHALLIGASLALDTTPGHNASGSE